MIGIIDYGLGNIRAIKNIYYKLNVPCSIINNIDDLLKSDKLILPGVGAFDWAMECLNRSGMRKPLDELVLKKSVPVLGICVGMQIMANSSEEGKSEGLGWINAKVTRFDLSRFENIQIPHMGWNSIMAENNHPLISNINHHKGFYFLHSFYFECDDQLHEIAYSNHGHNFSAAVSKNNIMGVQFHPEKSHTNGIRVFKNFAELEACSVQE